MHNEIRKSDLPRQLPLAGLLDCLRRGNRHSLLKQDKTKTRRGFERVAEELIHRGCRLCLVMH
jgi:hypothetical protein